MTFEEIAKELHEKAEQQDKKAILILIREDIPKHDAPCANHPNLIVLHKKREELETKVDRWWPSIDNTVVDDIHTFANFLQEFAKEADTNKSIPKSDETTPELDDESVMSPVDLARHFDYETCRYKLNNVKIHSHIKRSKSRSSCGSII